MVANSQQVIHQDSGRVLIPHAKWCAGFGSKLRGFTFRRQLNPEDGLVLVEKRDSRIESSITMLFVFFDLGILWVNDAGVVVDKTLARPWRLSYVSQVPARYVVEGHPRLLQEVDVGDRLVFQPAGSPSHTTANL
jgi:uncharacterized membrane protein (UPF0127 family)